MKTIVLTERGDLGAPPGSRPWAVAVKGELMVAASEKRSVTEHFSIMLRAFVKHKAFRVLEDKDGQKFRSFRGFCLHRYPEGLAWKPEDYGRLMGEIKAQARLRSRAAAEEETGEVQSPGGDRQSEEAKALCKLHNAFQGVQAAANGISRTTQNKLAQVARDHPDLHEKIKSGTLSVDAAFREATGHRGNITIQVKAEPATRQILKHFPPEEFIELIGRMLLAAGLPPEKVEEVLHLLEDV